MILCRQLMFLVFVIMALQVKAQGKHFIYIQSENKQPFYVQVNNQTYSSTASGYIIIPQLTKGKYYFITGFAKNAYPEQKFSIDIADKDAGYSLKQFDDKKWGLFDIVYFNTIMADNRDTIAVKENIASSQPAIKDTVAIVAADTAVIAKPVAIAALTVSNNKDTVAQSPAVKNDTVAIVSEPKEVVAKTIVNELQSPVITIEKPEPAAIVTAVKTVSKPIAVSKNKVAKTFERTAAKGIDQIYVDNSNKKKADTIAILIPLLNDTVKIKKTTPVKLVASPMPVKNTPAVKKCMAIATSEDFYKTRLDMASSTTDQSMILAAINTAKSKCFSTEQLKNLGFMFLSEQSRYEFFKALKPFIHDAEKYPSLQLQFTQSEWIEKFRASVKNN